MKERRMTKHEILTMEPSFLEYFTDKLKSNESSVLCGLPKREKTEIREDVVAGDIIIRYKPTQ